MYLISYSKILRLTPVISKSEGQTFYTSQIYIFLDLFPKNSSKIPCSECTLMLLNIA